MEWNKLKNIPKFTPLEKVYKEIGNPIFKLDGCCIYYMGNGFNIIYTERRFKIINSERIEYGDTGEYITEIEFFQNSQDLQMYHMLKQNKFNVDILGEPFEIINNINIGDTYKKVAEALRLKSTIDYYQEGETRSFHSGAFAFEKKFIAWSNYQFFFFGKSKNTKMSGMSYLLNEQ